MISKYSTTILNTKMFLIFDKMKKKTSQLDYKTWDWEVQIRQESEISIKNEIFIRLFNR